MDEFEKVTEMMHETYIKKNHDYGNAFYKNCDELGVVTAVGQMNIKMERIKSLMKEDAMVKGESMTDSLLDLANYCILTYLYLHKKK